MQAWKMQAGSWDASINPSTDIAHCVIISGMASIDGKSSRASSSITTRIAPSELSRIKRTDSSPETIAALLNEAEASHSNTPKHWNAKRVYPFWKVCQTCSAVFPCQTKEQAVRKRYCSRTCVPERPRKRKPMEQRKARLVKCAVCGKMVWKPNAWLRKVKLPTCSRHCNGILRGKEWARHAHKGRAAWTTDSLASYSRKMSGPNNPAWKGGVTYFRKRGSYKPIKYIRCPGEFMLMARKDGYVMEHRLFVARAVGRSLLRTEVVHHLNHDPQDNRLKNLQLFASNHAHKLYEANGSPPPLWQA